MIRCVVGAILSSVMLKLCLNNNAAVSLGAFVCSLAPTQLKKLKHALEDAQLQLARTGDACILAVVHTVS